MSDEKLSVEEVREYVEQSDDVGELESLLEGETRSTARKAIADRISQLTGGAVEVLDANPSETRYSRDDLLAGAEGFGTTAAGMAGALRLAGVTDATAQEAQQAVDEFNERRV